MPDMGEGAVMKSDHQTVKVDFNDTFEAGCDEGLYRFNGDRERVCQQNGLLSGHPLRCFAVCMYSLDQSWVLLCMWDGLELLSHQTTWTSGKLYVCHNVIDTFVTDVLALRNLLYTDKTNDDFQGQDNDSVCLGDITHTLHLHPANQRVKIKNMFCYFPVVACPLPEFNHTAVHEWTMNSKRLDFTCVDKHFREYGDFVMECLPNGTWVGEPLICGGLLLIILIGLASAFGL